MPVKLIFLDFGRRNFVNVTDNQLETVVEFKKILRNLSSRSR